MLGERKVRAAIRPLGMPPPQHCQSIGGGFLSNLGLKGRVHSSVMLARK